MAFPSLLGPRGRKQKNRASWLLAYPIASKTGANHIEDGT